MPATIWKFFKLSEDKRQTICNLCQKLLSYSGGSTSTMRNHLKMVHKRTTIDDIPKTSQTSLSSFRSTKPLPIKSELINRNLALMCVLDLRPVNIVSGRGFRQFVHSLNPDYQIPCRTTVTNYINKIYEEVKLPVINEMKCSIVSLTTDIWTSTEGYICLTGHYLNKNWQLQNNLLATRVMEDRHTGVNIAKMITDLTKEYCIKEVAAVVTDNASDMEKGINEVGFTHIFCFSHTIQLAINEGLKIRSICCAAGSARKVVGHFNHSVIALEALKKYQLSKNLDKSPLNIIQDVPTPWNSTYLMMKRLLELRVPVYSVLHDDNVIKPSERYKFDIQDSQWKIVEDLVPVLEPLADATEILASEKLPTASSIMVLVHGLLQNDLVDNEIDSKIISEFKSIVRVSMEKRFGFHRRVPSNATVNSPLMIATALDPLYKTLKFLSDEFRDTVRNNVEKLVDGESLFQEPMQLLQEVKAEPVSSPFKKNQFHIIFRAT